MTHLLTQDQREAGWRVKSIRRGFSIIENPVGILVKKCNECDYMTKGFIELTGDCCPNCKTVWVRKAGS